MYLCNSRVLYVSYLLHSLTHSILELLTLNHLECFITWIFFPLLPPGTNIYTLNYTLKSLLNTIPYFCLTQTTQETKFWFSPTHFKNKTWIPLPLVLYRTRNLYLLFSNKFDLTKSSGISHWIDQSF